MAAAKSKNLEPEHSMTRGQFEDLSIYLARVEAKIPDILADLIDLKSEKAFTCGSCYAVGEHRDSCKYDCP